jgi:hypothetical protein
VGLALSANWWHPGPHKRTIADEVGRVKSQAAASNGGAQKQTQRSVKQVSDQLRKIYEDGALPKEWDSRSIQLNG